MGPRIVALAALVAVAACAPANHPRPAPTPAETPPAAPAEPVPPVREAVAVDPALLESPSWETLRATLWVQRAAEFRGLSLGTYRAASRFLDRALADSSFLAAVEQTGDVRSLPPAVVLDVDETVLDNAPFQARLIHTGETFTPDAWDAWVAEAAARPMPGAVEFTRDAAARGVTVFYVTNRDEHHEEPTRRNMERLGFPLDEHAPDEEDVLLVRGEREEWGSDKTSRREWIAERYQIVVLLGDDLNDFVNVRGMDVEGRDRAYRAFEERVGRGWFFLPNPVYGSWEGALLEGAGGAEDDDASRPDERRRLLLERLDPGR